ncbi:hypothetical protein QQF64_018364 [Cirrhinus molitorella]|uniref:Uncharacterized protein n=1 Tax=Cirrhinus molitorella TaxID=172907 RepID=A0ABR3LCM8_9TELE
MVIMLVAGLDPRKKSEIQKLQNILTSADVQDPNNNPTTSASWCLRQSVAQDEWQKARSYHINCLLSCNVVPERSCSYCSSPAIIRCRDCVPQEWLCRYDLHLPNLQCRLCLAHWTPDMSDRIRSGYWPASVNADTLFSVDVFGTFEEMLHPVYRDKVFCGCWRGGLVTLEGLGKYMETYSEEAI